MASFQIPLDLVGEIRAASGDHELLVIANRDLITVDLKHPSVALAVLKQIGGREQRKINIRYADIILRRAAVRMQFQIADKTIAQLGADVHPGLFSRFLARLFGLGPVDIRPLGVKDR